MLDKYREQPKGTKGRSLRIRLWLIAVLACTLIFGLVILICYGADLISAKQTEAEMKEIYYSSTETKEDAPVPDVPEATEAPAGISHEETGEPDSGEETGDIEEVSGTAVPVPSEDPAFSGPVKLEPVPYPDNPAKEIRPRFRKLQEKNQDIAGWLKLYGQREEAVMQRDNSYYMTHDELNKANSNGAIFLDAVISQETRPYTLLLYGHNMKSGAKFGCLRNYEDTAFYKTNPFLTYESLYEENRYVIFAAGSISLEETQNYYIDIFMLVSDMTDERQAVIDQLQSASVFLCDVDVQPEDQLLLLVTCVDRDDRRRVVAARRIRDGEAETELMRLVESSTRENPKK